MLDVVGASAAPAEDFGAEPGLLHGGTGAGIGLDVRERALLARGEPRDVLGAAVVGQQTPQLQPGQRVDECREAQRALARRACRSGSHRDVDDHVGDHTRLLRRGRESRAFAGRPPPGRNRPTACAAAWRGGFSPARGWRRHADAIDAVRHQPRPRRAWRSRHRSRRRPAGAWRCRHTACVLACGRSPDRSAARRLHRLDVGLESIEIDAERRGVHLPFRHAHFGQAAGETTDDLVGPVAFHRTRHPDMGRKGRRRGEKGPTGGRRRVVAMRTL